MEDLLHYAKVTGKDNLVRDEESGAILNVDNKGLNAYRAARDNRIKQLEELKEESLKKKKEKKDKE